MYEIRPQQDGKWIIFAHGKAVMTCVRESDAIKTVEEAQQLLSAGSSSSAASPPPAPPNATLEIRPPHGAPNGATSPAR